MATDHGDCEESVSEVRVRVVAAQISDAIDAPEVRVRVVCAHTLAGIEVIVLASEVEAERMLAEVFVFTLATTDEEAVEIALIIEDVARFISLLVESDPLFKEAPVSVRVAYVHTSAAVSDAPPLTLEIAASIFVARTLPIDPIVVMVLVATFQILAGSPAIDAPSDVEAVDMAALVFALTELTTPAACVLVLAFTTAAIEVEAV